MRLLTSYMVTFYSIYRPPITPYNLFIHEISSAVKQEFPSATFSELPKIYSKKWSNLTAEEKQVNIYVCHPHSEDCIMSV